MGDMRDELRQNAKSPRGLTIGLAAVLALAALYFLPLAVVLLDEGVFRTFIISRNFPDSAADAFRTLYPFLK